MSERPMLGQRVLYKLTATDVERINNLRQDGSGRVGNSVRQGQQLAADVVAVFPNAGTAANLQAHVDGNFSIWPTSVCLGEEPGFWQRTQF